MTELAERVDRLDKRDAEVWEVCKTLKAYVENAQARIDAVSAQVDLIAALVFKGVEDA